MPAGAVDVKGFSTQGPVHGDVWLLRSPLIDVFELGRLSCSWHF